MAVLGKMKREASCIIAKELLAIMMILMMRKHAPEKINFPFYHSSANIIGTVAAFLCTIQCLVLASAIFPTEGALKRTFTEEGARR